MKKYFVHIIILVVALASVKSYGQPRPVIAGENIAVVSTKYGKVRGYIDDNIYAFKGIPYAKAERFMPPQTPNKWDGVRQCTIFGPQAMQSPAQDWGGQGDYNFGFLFNREPMDEKECFVLNVWTKGINDGKKRPVWVWIHGGGYSSGSANQLPCFDGCSMAKKGDIVVVSINHRLNVLGYLDLRGLGEKYSESVNLGMQDIVAALRWIHTNIENFGGDPNIVTIDGQSGGGGKVSTLMAMPSAAGLFQRAIVQSGSTITLESGDDSKAFGLAFAAAIGVNPKNTEKLNSLAYEELIKAGRLASAVLGAAGSNIKGGYIPSVDGKYITQSPFDPAPSEFSKNVAMLVGTDLNEFTYNDRSLITPKSLEKVKAILAERYGATNVEKFFTLFNKAYPENKEPHRMLVFDSQFRGRAIKQAVAKSKQNGAPVYEYLFTWQSPVNDGSLGACHGMELPFMFNNIEQARTLTGGEKDAYLLADKISSAWINFIKTGNPNSKDLPEWNSYSPENGATMIFDNKCKVVNDHDRELIEFVNSFPSENLFGIRR